MAQADIDVYGGWHSVAHNALVEKASGKDSAVSGPT
jgi:hypothetical protein